MCRRLAAALAVLAAAGCSGKPYVVEPGAEPGAVRAERVFVVSHGWHTGLVLPAAQLEAAVPGLAPGLAQPAYYEVGWGDKGFYEAREITTGLTLRAMFDSSGTVLHVVAVQVDPVREFPHSDVVETCVSAREMAALRAFVAGSFARGADGRAMARGPGIYGDSRFYDGEGRFHLLNTCNKWTAKGLRSAGLDLWPALRLTAGSVMGYLRDHRRACE